MRAWHAIAVALLATAAACSTFSSDATAAAGDAGADAGADAGDAGDAASDVGCTHLLCEDFSNGIARWATAGSASDITLVDAGTAPPAVRIATSGGTSQLVVSFPGGRTRLSCAFRMKIVQAGNGTPVNEAKLTLETPDGGYTGAVYNASAPNLLYVSHAAAVEDPVAFGPTPSEWVDVSLTLDLTGTGGFSATVDGTPFMKTPKLVDATSADRGSLTLGVEPRSAGPGSIEVLFDDVICD